MLIADIFTISGAVIFFIFGIGYLNKSISEKNHCNSIQKSLEEMNAQNRAFLFALMQGAAGGALALGTSIIYLQLQYSRQALKWIPVLILISSSIFFIISMNAMILVKRKTTVKPPIIVLLLAMLFVLVGYFINVNVA